MSLSELKLIIDQMIKDGVDPCKQVVVDYPLSWDSVMYVEDYATEYRNDNNVLIQSPVLLLTNKLPHNPA